MAIHPDLPKKAVSSVARVTLAVIFVPLLVIAGSLILALAFVRPPGYLAIVVGFLLASFAIWSVGAGNVFLRYLDIRDANVELGAIQAVYLFIAFAMVLIVLGFLNLFGVLPWR